MLTKQEQNIIIEKLKSFEPTRLAWSPFNVILNPNKLAILYDFNKTPDNIEFLAAIEDIQNQIHQPLDFTGFEFIPNNTKNEILASSTLFFSGIRDQEAGISSN